MNSITISDQLHSKVVAFKEVMEAVLGERMAFDTYIELVLDDGIEAIFENLLPLFDHRSLIRSFNELSSREPVLVFEHVAERIRAGELLAGGNPTHGRKLSSVLTSVRNLGDRAADGTK